MTLYAAICLDHPPHSGEKRDAARVAHREYVVANDSVIKLVGPMLDKDGNQCASFYIFDVESEQEVHDWLAKEPFVRDGVYRDVIVQEFFVGKNMLAPQDWPNAAN